MSLPTESKPLWLGTVDGVGVYEIGDRKYRWGDVEFSGYLRDEVREMVALVRSGLRREDVWLPKNKRN